MTRRQCEETADRLRSAWNAGMYAEVIEDLARRTPLVAAWLALAIAGHAGDRAGRDAGLGFAALLEFKIEEGDDG